MKLNFPWPLFLLQALFIGLRLGGVVHWNWFAVAAPIEASVVVSIALVVFIAIQVRRARKKLARLLSTSSTDLLSQLLAAAAASGHK